MERHREGMSQQEEWVENVDHEIRLAIAELDGINVLQLDKLGRIRFDKAMDRLKALL